MALESLRQVLVADYRGPKAVFSEVHVLKAILAIGREGSVGRGRLGSLTGLGQGEVRTLIKRMKENHLISITPAGCRLSSRGAEEFGRLSSVLAWSSGVDAGSLHIGVRCWAILVRGASKKVRFGLEQRDTAVKAGADGAFTSNYIGGRFVVAGEGTDCEQGAKEPWASIRRAGPVEGDAVVIAGSGRAEDAEHAALAAALTLL